MTLRRPAKLYVAAIIVAGLFCAASALWPWHVSNAFRFLAFLGLAVPAAALKIWMPGLNGTMSISFVFVLAGIVQFSRSEAMMVAIASVLVQCLWRTKTRPKLIQVLFNTGGMALAAMVSLQLQGLLVQFLPSVQETLRIAVVTSFYFVANTLPVSVIISMTERKSVRSIWRDCYFWSFPYYLVGAALIVVMRIVEQAAGWQASLMVLPIVYLFYRSYRQYVDRLEEEKKQAEEHRRIAEEQGRHASEMAALHLRTIQALALAIDAKDQASPEHQQRVPVYVRAIGIELGLSEPDLEALRAAALLHDIGKLAVPEHIISKPGRLTPEEFEKMKIHPVVGAEILERVQFPYPVVPIVRSHHEKWNGTGYPDGLKGEEIPIAARVLSAVDCLDALASDRQYRRALSLDQAMDVVISESGTSFDPQIVEILARRYRELEAEANGQAASALAPLTRTVAVSGEALSSGAVTSPAPTRAGKGESIDFLASIAAARQEVQALFELSQDLGNSLSLHDTLSMLSHRLKRLVPHDSLAVYLRHEDHLKPEYVTGDDFRLFSSLSIPIGQGLSGWVAESKAPILNGNPSVEPGYLNDPTKFSTLRAALAVPLEGADGILGVLTLYHMQRDVFTKDHLRVLLAICSKLALSIENTLRFRQAEDSATNDFLTGLPNVRSLFLHLEGEVARCRRERQPLAVLVGDLNGFKQVNDRFGHLEGNRLLQVVARALKAECRTYDYVARIGGDEFVIVLPNVSDDQLEAASDRFRACVVAAGLELYQEEMLSLSLGVARFPDEGDNAEQLLAAADRTMYKAKRRFKESRHAASLLHLASQTVQPVTEIVQ